MYMNMNMPYMSKDETKEENKKMSKGEKKVYGDYNGKMMAEYDLEVLTEAGAIRKNPKRLRKAVHCAKMKKEALEKVV